MNINQIEWFCLACEHRSFAKAAQLAHVSRQAFSKQMSNMERTLGYPLFKRDEIGVHPTERALAIYPAALDCMKGYQSFVQVADDQLLESKPIVRIGFADGIIDALPDDFLFQLEQECPYCQITVEKHYVNRCIDLLREDELDMVICSTPGSTAGLRERILTRFPIYVAIPRAIMDCSMREPTLEDLSHLEFFALGNDFPNDREVETLFEERGLPFRMNTQYNDYDIILNEVRRGRGCTFVPATCVDAIRCASVQIVDFPLRNHTWNIGLYYEEGLHAHATQQVIDAICAHFPATQPHAEKHRAALAQ